MIDTIKATETLCNVVVAEPCFRVKGPSEEYRCKATYSLYPNLVVSYLVMRSVNDIAAIVASYSSPFSLVFAKFFFEVMVKRNRKNEFIVKLVFLNKLLTETERNELVKQGQIGDDETNISEKTVFELWISSRDRFNFVAFLKERVVNLVGIVAHVRLPSCVDESFSPKDNLLAVTSKVFLTKPDKNSSYIPLYGDGRILEYTPNGYSYILSSDSFCEVNQPMEDAIYHSICEFLRLDINGNFGIENITEENSKNSRPRRAFITGRDVNSVVRTFEEYYDHVTVATSCPNVFGDTKLNGIQCIFTHKDKLCHILEEHIGERTSDNEEVHILITAGRHGLHPDTCRELVKLSLQGKVTDVVYVSCNVVSYSRDQHILKEGFRTTHIRTFDFFPGTDYVMSVIHYQSLLGEPLRGDLLVLPIGPPGVGKTSFGKFLINFFSNTSMSDGIVSKTNDKAIKDTKKSLGSANQGKTAVHFIPRHYVSLPSNVKAQHVERDALFHTLKTEGHSLRETRKKTDEGLLASLSPTLEKNSFHRNLVYLDSTNGSFEARTKYRTLWSSRKESCPDKKLHDKKQHCLELYFTFREKNVILERLKVRRDHPSFPDEPEQQEAKFDTIQTVFETGECVSAVEGSSLVVFYVDETIENVLFSQALLAVFFQLYLSADLASALLPSAFKMLNSS